MKEERNLILVVEDDVKVAHNITKSMRAQGLSATSCGTGEAAAQYIEKEAVELVVLDLGLPDMDGADLLRILRKTNRVLPVLILTARDGISDRIAGLDAGADDYLVKPFALPELHARIRALLRRFDLGRQAVLTCGDLSLDTGKRSVERAGRAIYLTQREFELLQYLLERKGQVVTKSMLAIDVWKYNSRITSIDNVIDVLVCRLREKIDKGYEQPLLHTVRAVGLMMKDP